MAKYNIGAVVAEFNYDITHMMLELAKEEAKIRDCEITKVVMVPGVFDMALAIKKLTEADQDPNKDLELDCIITLGTVIEGATDHDQIVAQHASRKIADLALEWGKPISLGISGPGMTRLDAHRRVTYGKNAVEAAVKMCDRLKDI
ncbi:MAG: 6,7-dimethyl-8-ribityllumazine synthase [Methanobacteriaceae archaeon]|nr:6,7-dimethyl-8-ribityllumazine synthase [Methanobacteriaceae archaeon]